MARPRIIIADNDYNYIMHLKLKFAKDYGNSIDLEVITDRQYFNELFITPQKADALIVCEEFYEPTLIKHNISNFFLMVERIEDAGNDSFDVTKLFKYSTLKEIFNEITSKCPELSVVESKVKHDPEIFVVTSPIGGSGKTTFSMGLSVCLSRNFKKVLYINASNLHSFQYMLENKVAMSTQNVCTYLIDATSNVYNDIKNDIRTEIFSYLPPFKNSLISLGVDFSVYSKIALSAKASGDYDFIIIDVDNSFDDNLTALLDIADKVLVITKQNEKALFATSLFVDNISKVDSDKYVFICNDFDKDKNNAWVNEGSVHKFVVSDYINKIDDFEFKDLFDLGSNQDIQKIALSII